VAAGQFLFVGFLPRRRSARWLLLASLAQHPSALVAYESPHRLLDTLADLDRLFGPRHMAVCGELTKLYEETRRGTPAALLTHFRQHKPRGEYTLVIAGAEAAP
jgi:16S rRNA (cytidine1402-2'-O)-methyltransferase